MPLYRAAPVAYVAGQNSAFQTDQWGNQFIRLVDANGAPLASIPVTATPATVGAGVDTNAARVVEASADASTDRSGTITLGGTAQNAMAANTSRRFWALTNNSDTVMMVRVGGTASATAGVKVNTDDLVYGAEIDAISVFCATTGKAFTAWEY